jgi:hypothetical protein
MHNVKKGDTYLPFRKEFTIKMDNRTLQQKQGTNVVASVLWTLCFTYGEQKIEVTY